MNIRLPKLTAARSLQIFQLLRFAALFLSSVAIARLIGDKDLIGQFEKLVLIGSSFSFFWVSGIINAFIPFYHSLAEERRPTLIFNVFVLLSGLSLLVYLGLYAFGGSLFSGPSVYLHYYLLFTLFSAPAFLLEYILLMRQQKKLIVIYGLLSASLHFCSIAVPLLLGYSLQLSLFFLVLSGAARYLLLSLIIVRLPHKRIDTELIKPFLNKAFPLIISLVLGGSMAYIDSYIVSFFYNSSQFAIYQYGARELPLVMLMANALSNVLSGEIAEAQRNTRVPGSLENLKKSSLRLMHLLYPLTIILLLISRLLYVWVYKASFAPASHIFNVYLLLIISRLVFPQTVLLGLQQNRLLLLTSFIETLLNVCLDLLFLYFFGLVGIAIATVVAYMMEKLMQMYILHRRGIQPKDYIPIGKWLSYSTITLLVCIIAEMWI